MSIIYSSLNKVSPAALALMLTVVFLSLYDAGFDNNVLYWVLIPLLIVTILLTLRNKIILDISYTEPIVYYALFLLWAGISIFWSLNPHRTLVEFLQLSLYGATFLLASSLNEKSMLRVGRISIILGLAVALFGISQFLFLSSSRITSTFTNPNPLGIFLVMIFFASWGYYLRKRNRHLAVVSLIILAALILTGSRGSFICFILAAPFMMIGLQKSEIKKATIHTLFAVAGALVIAQVITIIAPYLQEAVGSRTALANFLTRPESFIARSGLARFNYWIVGMKTILNEPFAGHGLGTFFLAYYTEYDGGRWYSRFAHNHYIQTMVELGFIGFTLFLGFILTTARKAWKVVLGGDYPIIVPGLIAAGIAFLINIGADFSWNFPGSAIIFFVICGCIVSIGRSPTAKKYRSSNIVLVGTLLIILLLTGWQLTANLLYRQGVILEGQGDLVSAAATYDRANAIYPINSMAYSFASSAYYRLAMENEGNTLLLTKALASANRSVELSPVDGNLHNQLGRIYWEAGYIEEAEQHLKLGVEYAAYRLNLLIDLAWFYIQQGRNDEAAAIIEKALLLEDAAVESARTDEDEQRVESYLELLYQLKEIVE